MGTEKRDRKKANRQAKLEQQLAAEAKAKRARSLRSFAILIAAVVVVLLLISLVGCSSDSDGAKAPSTTAKSSTAYGTGECPPEDGVDEPVLDFDAPFAQCIDEDTVYRATIETTEGTVVAELDPSAGAPIAVNNFVSLARNGYYDDVAMFRTEAQTGIIQTGSPHTQSGMDPGPGYTLRDEGVPWGVEDYGPGTLAMANRGPDTAGGQFFFLANEGGRYLGDPEEIGPSAGGYTVFGKVTEGLEVLEAIVALEVPGSGTPSKDVRIEKVTIEAV